MKKIIVLISGVTLFCCFAAGAARAWSDERRCASVDIKYYNGNFVQVLCNRGMNVFSRYVFKYSYYREGSVKIFLSSVSDYEDGTADSYIISWTGDDVFEIIERHGKEQRVLPRDEALKISEKIEFMRFIDVIRKYSPLGSM